MMSVVAGSSENQTNLYQTARRHLSSQSQRIPQNEHLPLK